MRARRRRGVSAVILAVTVAGCADQGADPLTVRGRQVYLSQCIQCHNSDPAQAGAIGPPLKGAPRELLEAKVLRGVYPPGYRPKRATAVMPPLPTVAPDIEALAAFLK